MSFLQIQPMVARLKDRGRSSPRKRTGHEDMSGTSLKPLGFVLISQNQAENAKDLSPKGSSRPE